MAMSSVTLLCDIVFIVVAYGYAHLSNEPYSLTALAIGYHQWSYLDTLLTQTRIYRRTG